MSDQSKQNISELMDGELGNDCSRFLLKRMMSDESLKSSWSNYHIMRSCLQKEHDAPLMENLGAEVVKQLQQDRIEMTPKTNRFNGVWKALAGSAIAASVAFVSVLALNQGQNEVPGLSDQPVFAKTAQQIVNPPAAQQVRQYTRYPSLTPQIQQYLTETNQQPQIPVYYNTEYANQLLIQVRKQVQQERTAE